jgi:hypothetical protein
MTDTYGNYFCQKLIQCCSAEQRIFILKHIVNNFEAISCNSSGTHALQSLIEIVNMPGEEELLKVSVESNLLKLSIDVNGTHVVQKIISCITEDSREKINEIILDNFNSLVYDPNGICVLKKIINGAESIKLKQRVISKIMNNPLEIIQNPFGNYIVQHIFEEWGVDICKEVINIILNNVISLSMQKFSSNVVERCLI